MTGAASDVIVVGGGLAGLAAAVVLGERGRRVLLLEARPRLGGRAGSFHDTATGQLVDACQHVSLGCCTEFADWCQSVGIAGLLQPQPTLWFMTADRRMSRWQADPLPAPLHLARSFLRAHFLTWGEKVAIARALRGLQRLPTDADGSFGAWLDAQGQTERVRRRFWATVLVSALNERPERVGLKYARKVFVDSFLTDRAGGVMALPTVPLGRLYGPELAACLERLGVQVRLATAVRGLDWEKERVAGVTLRSGERLASDAVILAVPHGRVAELWPAVLTPHPILDPIQNLSTASIVSVHLWVDRPLTPLPHVVLVDMLGQWLFNRGEVEPGVHYVQVVISAAEVLRAWGHERVREAVVTELRQLFPVQPEPRILRSRVVTEVEATFSPVPGVDRWRPTQRTPVPGLFLAGDWTATGWPATMEGAVRSGRLAAAALLAESR